MFDLQDLAAVMAPRGYEPKDRPVVSFISNKDVLVVGKKDEKLSSSLTIENSEARDVFAQLSTTGAWIKVDGS